jgi:anti-sigma factor RsiW
VPDDEELDPREAQRVRRRDREADAAQRELMRPGMGKVFKQILDRQSKDAVEPPKRRPKR